MNLLLVMLIGVGIGSIVEILLPRHRMGELVLVMLLGVMGALLARYGGQLFGWYASGEAAEFLGSGVGAILVLLLYGAVFRRGRAP